MKLQIAHVVWVDSMEKVGWQEIDNKLSLQCESAGFVVERNKERIILAKNYSHGVNCISWGGMMHIPMCAVKKIKIVSSGNA